MSPEPGLHRRAYRSPLPAAALASLAVLLSAGIVLAHAELVESSPADGATVPPPTEVVATFSQAMIAARSSLEVRDAAGATVAKGGVDPADPKRQTMRVPLPELAPGVYTVRWTAVADDGHVERGTFSFEVTPPPSPSPSPSPSLPPSPTPTTPPVGPSPSPSPSPSLSPAPTPSPAPGGTAEGGLAAVVLPIVVGLAVAATAAAWLLRRRGG